MSRRGGPLPSHLKRHQLAIRIRPALRRLIERSAAEMDWSLSREIEARLERSFRSDEEVYVALDLKYRNKRIPWPTKSDGS